MNNTKKEQKPLLAKNIIARRKALGMTQFDLAHRSGLALNTVKLIEAGKSEGWASSRKAIAGALNCTTGDLFLNPNTKEYGYLGEYDSIGGAAQILDKISKATPQHRSYVLALLFLDRSMLPKASPDVEGLFKQFVSESTK